MESKNFMEQIISYDKDNYKTLFPNEKYEYLECFESFNKKIYKTYYPDLVKKKELTKKQYWNHYYNYGFKDERINPFKCKNIYYLFIKLKHSEKNKLLIQHILIKLINVSTHINKKNDVLIVMSTHNQCEKIENFIKMITTQTYSNNTFLIINDRSDQNNNNIFKSVSQKYNQHPQLIFIEKENIHGDRNYLNIGIDYFRYMSQYQFFTWILDTNIYTSDFIENLKSANLFFNYSSYNISYNQKTYNQEYKYYQRDKCYSDLNDFLYNFDDSMTGMWTREAIEKIGFYTENIDGCENYEFLLRTFQINFQKCIYIPKQQMIHLNYFDRYYETQKKLIVNLQNNIRNNFYWKQCIDYNKNWIIYYSTTNNNLMIQRPKQIMRFFDHTYNKIYVDNIEQIHYEEKYKLLFIPQNSKEDLKKILETVSNQIFIYYTDRQLYIDLMYLPGKKIYDMSSLIIDRNNFWKQRARPCIENSDFVLYNQLNLIKELREIDNSKSYYYISNACDYEHFSQAKERINNRPINFPPTNKPILGYYGSIGNLIDWDIILKYADQNDYYIVLISVFGEKYVPNIRYKHSNITIIESITYELIPYYLSWFDKCFLPFKDCQLTRYSSPNQLWEYMSSEKEIIKYNVNNNCDKILTYKNICNQLLESMQSDHPLFGKLYISLID